MNNKNILIVQSESLQEYIYHNCNARVFGIADDSQIIGVALVRDFTEEPINYDLQQFMIDQRFQNKGYGTEALRLILDFLKQEGRYNSVEVCVNREDTMADDAVSARKAGMVRVCG